MKQYDNTDTRQMETEATVAENVAFADDADETNYGTKRRRRGWRQWSRRKRRAWMAAGVALLLVCITGGIGYSIYHNAQMKVQLAYEILDKNECIADYEDFLKTYPDSKYVPEVKQRLENLRRMHDDWSAALKANTKARYVAFRDKYPESILMGHQCGLKIDSLDWMEAEEIGTIEAYRRYLSLHPSGRYAQQASVACGEIDDVTMREDEKTDIGSRVRGFFAAFSAGNDASSLSYLSVPMSECLGQSGRVGRDEILAALHDYNSGVVDMCRFNVGNDLTTSKILDSNGVPTYSVSCSVDMHATISGCEAFSSYRAQITMNSKYRITRLRLIEVATTTAAE